ncbi:MAG: glutamine synthetase family protein, partial [Thermomicrobiales bacterium]
MTSNLALSFREESTSPQSLERFLSERGIDFLLVQFVNLHGRPSGKLIPSSAAYESVVRGVPFGGYSAEALGRAPEESDLIARPDLASLTLLPWKPNVAWVAADLTDQSGAEYPYCSRSILRRQLDDLRSSEQLSMQTGPELEYYLVRGNGATLPEPIDETVGPPRSAYSVRRLVGHLDFAAEVTRYLEQMGWEAYAVDHEDGAGQFEHNFKYADALETADRTILFRQMVGALAGKRGLTATFMPKPFMHQAGSGGHLHLSLWRDDKNLFATTPNDGSLQPAELSAMGRSFLAGLLHHAPAYVAITAPLVNSYKRLRPATSVSGHNWTSSGSCWGRENRTALFRIPGGGRIE